MGKYIHSKEQVIDFLKKSKESLEENWDHFIKDFNDGDANLVVRDANDIVQLTKRIKYGQYKGGAED